MREAGLQPKRRRPHPKTSDGKGQGNWPNLLKDENLKVEAPGQVWVADITYIAGPGGFAYLACFLDVFLRKIVGWSLSKHIDAKLTLAALQQALATCPPSEGWIQHSDRGSQYLCDKHVKLVQGAGGRVSCSDKASPQDNAFMESFFKTLKAEEVWLEDYADIEQPTNRSARAFDTTIPSACTRPSATSAPSNSRQPYRKTTNLDVCPQKGLHSRVRFSAARRHGCASCVCYVNLPMGS
jgi:transposase InsO family protein